MYFYSKTSEKRSNATQQIFFKDGKESFGSNFCIVNDRYCGSLFKTKTYDFQSK